MTHPTLAQVLSLPALFDQTVSEDFIDENGHMNITDYFRLATWAPWKQLVALGMDADYISRRGLSFFTVGHHVSYLSELRLGERFSVHAGFAGRTSKALHAVGFVVDREHDRIACVLEAMYVHVSMTGRRATPIPDDLSAALDAEMSRHGAGWLPEAAHGLTLRRESVAADGTLRS